MTSLFNQSKIYDSAVEVIGGTPMIRLNRLAKAENIECEILAKCEFFNPGGSIKDRIAKRMILEAQKEGIIKPGCELIEPTSGNTGIGIALMAALLGYKCSIVIPEKMSREKIEVLKCLGANIIRTPTEAPSSSPESHLSVAQRLNSSIPGSWVPNQYENENNWKAHYEQTAEEILTQCDGKIDVLVAGAGTGGTITGIGKRLKEVNPNVLVVGVDPYGSLLADPERGIPPEEDVPYLVEGIGYDFIPKSLDRSYVDKWVKVGDRDSFLTARNALRIEGLLCGGSSGANLFGAIQIAKTLKKGQRLVVILPDSIRNYMTKHLIQDWLIYNNLVEPSLTHLGLEPSGGNGLESKMNNLSLSGPKRKLGSNIPVDVIDNVPAVMLFETLTLGAAFRFISAKDVTHAVFVKQNARNVPIAVVTRQNLVDILASKKASLSTALEEAFKACKSQSIKVFNTTSPANDVIPEIVKNTYALLLPPKEKVSDSYGSLRMITITDLFNFVSKYQIEI